MIPGTILLLIGLLLTGLAPETHCHWIVPDIVSDTHTVYPVDGLLGAALAAVSFLRSLAGFTFPLFAPAMYKSLGFGKGDTILAVAAIVIGCLACVTSLSLQ
jgi:hypothetical protein